MKYLIILTYIIVLPTKSYAGIGKAIFKELFGEAAEQTIKRAGRDAGEEALEVVKKTGNLKVDDASVGLLGKGGNPIPSDFPESQFQNAMDNLNLALRSESQPSKEILFDGLSFDFRTTSSSFNSNAIFEKYFYPDESFLDRLINQRNRFKAELSYYEACSIRGKDSQLASRYKALLDREELMTSEALHQKCETAVLSPSKNKQLESIETSIESVDQTNPDLIIKPVLALSRSELFQLRSIDHCRPISKIYFTSVKVKKFFNEFRSGVKRPAKIFAENEEIFSKQIYAWKSVPEERRIFIIGSSEDALAIEAIEVSLRNEGFSTFFYKHVLDPDGNLPPSELVGTFFSTSGKTFVYEPSLAKGSSYIAVESETARRYLAGEQSLIVFSSRDLKIAIGTTSTGLVGCQILKLTNQKDLAEPKDQISLFALPKTTVPFPEFLSKDGMTAYQDGKFLEARRLWREYLSEMSNHHKSEVSRIHATRMNIAACDLELGEIESAVEQLKSLIIELDSLEIRNSLAARCRHHLARSLVVKNETTEARLLFQEALQIYADLPYDDEDQSQREESRQNLLNLEN